MKRTSCTWGEMRFGGIQKSSFIDFPGKISCVFFVCGCNFACPYCHNPELVKDGGKIAPDLTPQGIDAFLEKRQGLLDGVVISGGEPTLQKELPQFCRYIKDKGFAVKLDTNGSRPKMLSRLIDQELVDYIALDIKTDPNAYPPEIRPHNHPEDILESIRLTMASGVDYEFRTTCAKPFVDADAIRKICRMIRGARRYVLQQFQNTQTLCPDFCAAHADDYDFETLHGFQTQAAAYVKECSLR